MRLPLVSGAWAALARCIECLTFKFQQLCGDDCTGWSSATGWQCLCVSVRGDLDGGSTLRLGEGFSRTLA